MKKTIILSILSLITMINQSFAQDSLYFYNSDGTKSWWYVQPDVILFKNIDNSSNSILFDTNIVENIDFWGEEYRKFNELKLNQNLSNIQIQSVLDLIINSNAFEIFAPAITKFPLESYISGKYLKTDDQLLVTFNDPMINDATIQNFMSEYGLDLIHQPSSLLNNSKNWTYIFKINNEIDTLFQNFFLANLIFESEPDLIKICQPNIYSGDALNCRTVSEMNNQNGGIYRTWGIYNNGGAIFNSWNGVVDADADICECWGEGYDGNGIKIGVMDFGGFEYNHPDIANLQPGYKLFTNPIESFNTNTYANSANGHGMAVVGVIGATPNNTNLGARGAVGMAHGSVIHPYLLGSINSADIIKGLQQVVIDDIDVLNMSFRSVFDQSVALQLENCFDIGRPSNSSPNGFLGMILVASSGNTDLQESNFPANHTSVIGVGMSNPNDYRSSYNAPVNGWTMNLLDGSTYGPPSYGYDVVAPGELMFTLDLQGDNGFDFGDYQLSSGTSVSAPVVSSIAAILLQKNSQLTNTQVRDLLRNGAEKKYPTFYNYNMYPNVPGYNNEMFYGRVSCINSLDLTTLGFTDISINPNLTIAQTENNKFIINVPIQIEEYQIEIINGQGQKIKTFENKLDTSGENTITLDLGTLSSGVYFVNLLTKNGLSLSGKIIK
jgi:subtilisin family serine protease